MMKVFLTIIIILLSLNLSAQYENKNLEVQLHKLLQQKLRQESDSIKVSMVELNFDKSGYVSKIRGFYKIGDSLKSFVDNTALREISFNDIPQLSAVNLKTIVSKAFLIPVIIRSDVDNLKEIYSENLFSANAIIKIVEFISTVSQEKKIRKVVLKPLIVFELKPVY